MEPPGVPGRPILRPSKDDMGLVLAPESVKADFRFFYVQGGNTRNSVKNPARLNEIY